MELFSELYGCYYHVVAKLLQAAGNGGLTRGELDRIVEEHAFSDSGFHLIPRLLDGSWDLLRREDDRYYSKLEHQETHRPLTHLEQSWLRALLEDRRIGLFLDPPEQEALSSMLADQEPLYHQEDFFYTDTALDGDPYTDVDYIARFRLILEAIRDNSMLLVNYQGPKGSLTGYIWPWKLQFSAKDDKFRLLAAHMRLDRRPMRVVLNLSRIGELKPCDRECPPREELEELHRDTSHPDPVVLEITGERNALERCMLHFASYNKTTRRDASSGRHICEIYYDKLEETELLIRILSFGPVVRVLGPESFLRQVRQRVSAQRRLLEQIQ